MSTTAIHRIYTMPTDDLVHHDCHTADPQARINTDCGHALRTTDPACTGCALRNDE